MQNVAGNWLTKNLRETKANGAPGNDERWEGEKNANEKNKRSKKLGIKKNNDRTDG